MYRLFLTTTAFRLLLHFPGPYLIQLLIRPCVLSCLTSRHSSGVVHRAAPGLAGGGTRGRPAPTELQPRDPGPAQRDRGDPQDGTRGAPGGQCAALQETVPGGLSQLGTGEMADRDRAEVVC